MRACVDGEIGRAAAARLHANHDLSVPIDGPRSDARGRGTRSRIEVFAAREVRVGDGLFARVRRIVRSYAARHILRPDRRAVVDLGTRPYDGGLKAPRVPAGNQIFVEPRGTAKSRNRRLTVRRDLG